MQSHLTENGAVQAAPFFVSDVILFLWKLVMH